MTAAVLRLFRRIERPVAWTILVLSLVAFVAIVSSIWVVDDPVTAALGALILIYDGFQAVQTAEDDTGE